MTNFHRVRTDVEGDFILEKVSGEMSSTAETEPSSSIVSFVMNKMCSNSIFAFVRISFHILKNNLLQFIKTTDNNSLSTFRMCNRPVGGLQIVWFS